MVAHYQYYPRSVSWQVASVLNPSLQKSLPLSQLSSHSREKREREGAKDDPAKPQPPPQPSTAFQAWQQEEAEESRQRLTLPPQYVSLGDLCKAMPKYSRLKGRPKTNGARQPVAFSTASATDPALMSPRYDLAAAAAASPRSHDSSSAREIQGRFLTCQQEVQQTKIGSTVTSPLPSVSTEGCKATPISATLLSSKLSTLAQCLEQAPQAVVMKSTAQGSPLSPTNNMWLRLSCVPTPPVALEVPILTTALVTLESHPRLRKQRIRGPHPPEPTLEMYKKASPNTHATNTVWNDRRNTSREQTDPCQSILIKNT